MTFRELAVPGAWEITPQVHGDSRGSFFEWFAAAEFQQAAGHDFTLQQANCSQSAAGVLRGLHFAQLPPSQAKYVTCVRGAVFDVVVDIRVGSPTFGQWDSVLLDDVDHRTIYLSAGLAHGFLALHDDSTVMYLCSEPYSPTREHTIDALDPAIGISWPLAADRLVLSERDAAALSLADVAAAGLLPTWEAAIDFDKRLRRT